MNSRPLEEAVTADLRNAFAALRRAAKRAREVAAQTGTAIVVSRDGVIEHIHPQPVGNSVAKQDLRESNRSEE